MKLPFTIGNRPIQGNFDALLALVARLSGLRVVRGIVDATGAKLEGADFTSTKPGTGDYTVTFAEAFDDLPAVIVSAQSSTNRVSAQVKSVANGSVDVITYVDAAGANSDQVFHFIAIGP